MTVWKALLESGKPHGILPCGLGAATRSDSRRRCRFTATSCRSRSTPTRPAWAGRSSSTRASSPAATRLTDWKAAPGLARVGLKLEAKRIARQGAMVFSDETQVGEVTSGTFSPTLQVSLAMALVDLAAAAAGTPLDVDVRGHREPAHVVKLPFYKRRAPPPAASSVRSDGSARISTPIQGSIVQTRINRFMDSKRSGSAPLTSGSISRATSRRSESASSPSIS